MKTSVRSLFYMLVVPLTGALVALLLGGLIPFFGVRIDLKELDGDIRYSKAARRFESQVSEQSRAYADLIIYGGSSHAHQARVAGKSSRAALEAWRAIAPADRSFLAMAAAFESLSREGDVFIGMAAQGRQAEARGILFREIYPASIRISREVDDALAGRHVRLLRSLARMSGGIDYSPGLRFGNLGREIDGLEGDVNEAIGSAVLRRSIQREVRAYWYFSLFKDRLLLDEIAVNRQRGDQALRMWRKAVTDHPCPNQIDELRMIDDAERTHHQLQHRGEKLIELTERGADEEARSLLVGPMELQRTALWNAWGVYIDDETRSAAQHLANMNRQTRNMRLVLLSVSAATLLFAFAVPWIISRRLLKPLVNLQKAAKSIGRGELGTSVAVPPIEEVADLVMAFNAMTADLKASRGQLERSEERFQLAARAANDMIWDLDVTTQEVWFGEGFRARLGMNGPKSSWTQWHERIHQDDRERIRESVEAAVNGTEAHWSDDYRVRRADGAYAYVYDRGLIVRDAAGAAQRVIGAAVDVTERMLADEAIASLNRQKEMILDSVGDGIIGLDAGGRIISANPAASRMLGFDALIGSSMSAVVQATAPKGMAVERTLAGGGLQRSDDEIFRRGDGSEFPVEYVSNAMCDENGTVVGAVVTFRDVTEAHEVERMKSQFVSTVSHELRTPLTSIRGALGLLRGGVLGDLSDKGQRMVEIAVTNTDRLVRLINDILDIERLDSGEVKPDRKEIEVSALLQQTYDLMKPLADKCGVAIDVRSCQATIWADPDRVIQMLTNLASNAVKFSPPATTITLKAEKTGQALLFSVSDRGRGIPEDKREMIFERFRQVDASDSRDKGGSGLGLSICRSIAQQHGGRIWVESELGRGSTFFVTIPLTVAATGSEPRFTPGWTVPVCDSDASIEGRGW
jgi:PAS domain S-box-containing protein